MTAQARPVIVVPYDPAWPESFAGLRNVLEPVLGDLSAGIEHVGSTAVPGLAAKPIIDIDVVIPGRGSLPEAIARLATLGYAHEGDLGIAGREAFDRSGADVPRDGSGRTWPEHHLYVCAVDAEELRRHIAFRDWLRAHPDDAREYGALKQRLADTHRADREAYTEAKTELVEAVLARARRENEHRAPAGQPGRSAGQPGGAASRIGGPAA